MCVKPYSVVGFTFRTKNVFRGLQMLFQFTEKAGASKTLSLLKIIQRLTFMETRFTCCYVARVIYQPKSLPLVAM